MNTIFDNINEYGGYIVDVGKTIVYGLSHLPQYINSASDTLIQFTADLPPFISFSAAFICASGIICKCCHWGE